MRHTLTRLPLAAMGVGAVAVAGARAEDVVLLETQSALRTIDAVDGSTRSRVRVKGIDGLVQLLGIDTRPSDRRLYGVTRNRLWVLDPDSGWATPVGPEFEPYDERSGSIEPGQAFDFDPAAGAARAFVQGPSAGTNPRANHVLRIDPDTGVVSDPLAGIDRHPHLAYAAGDAGSGQAIGLVLAAHDHNVAGATQTTAFGIDIARRTLIRIGDLDAPAPATGEVPVQTVGALTAVPDGDLLSGLEIDASGAALLLTTGVQPFELTLRRIDLATGGVTSSLKVPFALVTDLAIAPFPTLPATEPLDLRTAVVRYDAARARRNTVEVHATVPIPADGWKRKVVRIDMSHHDGGDKHIAREFVLDRRGRGADGPDTFAVTGRANASNARVTIRLRGVDLWSLNVYPQTATGPLPLDVDLLLDGRPLHAQADLVYTATPGRGVATLSRK